MLECLQKSLRIAGSAIEEIVTVQLYCDTLDHYLYYFDRGAPAVRFLTLSCLVELADYSCGIQITAKFVNSLVELISSRIDNISSPDVHPTQRAPPGLIEGVQTPEMITRHFRNSLAYIQRRKSGTYTEDGSAVPVDTRWDDVNVVGALLKMGLVRS